MRNSNDECHNKIERSHQGVPFRCAVMCPTVIMLVAFILVRVMRFLATVALRSSYRWPCFPWMRKRRGLLGVPKAFKSL